MALMHFGYLKPCTKGSKPEVVKVKGGKIVASFNTWFSTKVELRKEKTIIIAEAIFVKKVGMLFVKRSPNNLNHNYVTLVHYSLCFVLVCM